MDISIERTIPTPLVNSTFFTMLLWSLTRQKHSPDTVSTFYKDYDYIIVGGGTAGSVLAARLSEKPCASILLLEAGDPPPIISEVVGVQKSLVGTYIDWKFSSTPQRYTCESMENRVSFFGFHGRCGPLAIVEPPYRSELKERLLENAKLMGYEVGDINGPLEIGYHDLQYSARDGQRLSTAKRYLVPAEHRQNLHILSHAFVRKIIIKDGIATGVEFDYKEKIYEINAQREVVLSAGTYNTAQLLMLSGIGPREELEKFQIPVIADLPVGKNLQNHFGVPMVFLLDPSIESKSEKLKSDKSIIEYIHHRTGPLSSAAFIIAMAVLNSNRTLPINVPDYEIFWQEIDIQPNSTTYGLRKEVAEQFYGPYAGQPAYACFPSVLQPKSRGVVSLQSTNPYDRPLIDPNYFQDPVDVEINVNGMKECMRVGTSVPMQSIGSTPISTLFPNCEQYAEDEDSYYACMTRQFVATSHHQVGTAKMGDPNDPTTVVDPKLRVKNIERLRVVDASVMPLIPTAHTYIPTVMVAEKASDIIKSTFRCNRFGRRYG
ncbi:glucose dehydrogenase [FAD, quinone]-like isoform X2 [Uloborus diversus]|uniref:glucose dehydrogenase [FAD, quinone]-like isoform X2 n=1 Tax=Uloborus diversus TaxID=327109 RepID=UPI00240926CB|nr:glucose dehydrogenase [FAD, quinone]-like isoform X2 [Uloborus diversus]